MHAASVLESVLKQVAEAPERVAALLDARPEALMAFDARRVLLGANEAAERYFGYERRALDGHRTDALVPPRFRQPDPPAPLATPDLTTVELPALRHDGTEVVTVWTYGSVMTAAGPLFVLIVRERTTMLAELESLTYTTLFEESPFPLSLTKLADNTTVAINQAFADLFELDRANVIGRPASDLGLSNPALRERITRMLAEEGAVRDLECELRTSTGKALQVATNVTRVRIAGVEFALVTIQDISQRKAQEAALARAMEQEKQARAEAEAANRAKDEFLATMSHELRTPLSAIMGWAAMLRRKPREEEKLDHGLAVIDRNVHSLERLVADLLDMSRILSGKLALNLTRTSLWEVANAAAEVVRPAAEAKGVRLIVDLDPDLPSVIGDLARLQQVLWNLLTNAVRFTPRGGRIVVTGERAGAGVRLRVQDSGQGIDPQHLARIFERFRQVDSSTTRAHGGLGLGLAIVRYLVEAHGGQVEARSDGLGHGAEFSVTLPVSAVDTSVAPFARPPGEDLDDAGGSSPNIPLAPEIDLSKVRVLVVDDDGDSLDLLRTVLESAGADVTSASSAQAALAEPGPFDVILSDLGMPELDGYDLLRRIRSRDPGGGAPAIALTAYVGREHVERAERAGFCEHVAKPIDASRLLETVQRWSRSRAST
jgi:PAS domain S-box-containing protein